MPLQKWSVEHPPLIGEGYALFCTQLTRHRPQSYHAMLVVTKAVDPEIGAQVRICDMAPPMRFGDQMTDVHHLGEYSYVGSLDHLTTRHYQQVLAAAYSLRGRPPNANGSYGTYWLGTHGVDVEDPNDPGSFLLAPHCSCASLVEWCYEQIGVDLVSARHLPAYSASEVRDLFCPWMSKERLLKSLGSVGLSGDGPWQLLLPAQQMRAFASDPETLPYRSSKADHPWIND